MPGTTGIKGHSTRRSAFELFRVWKRCTTFRATGNPSSWLGPVWGVSNYLVWRGLVNYGFRDEAEELGAKQVQLFGRDLTLRRAPRILPARERRADFEPGLPELELPRAQHRGMAQGRGACCGVRNARRLGWSRVQPSFRQSRLINWLRLGALGRVLFAQLSRILRFVGGHRGIFAAGEPEHFVGGFDLEILDVAQSALHRAGLGAYSLDVARGLLKFLLNFRQNFSKSVKLGLDGSQDLPDFGGTLFDREGAKADLKAVQQGNQRCRSRDDNAVFTLDEVREARTAQSLRVEALGGKEHPQNRWSGAGSGVLRCPGRSL